MKPWSISQKRYLFKHYHDKPLPQIAKDLGRTERALNLFIHRYRNDPRLCVQKDNLLLQVLKKKFKDVGCFTPTRSFFNDVEIGQKRYWSIYKGSEVIKDAELKRIADYFDVTLEGIHEILQMTMFENE